jgi:hypothetical protein
VESRFGTRRELLGVLGSVPLAAVAASGIELHGSEQPAPGPKSADEALAALRRGISGLSPARSVMRIRPPTGVRISRAASSLSPRFWPVAIPESHPSWSSTRALATSL